MKQKKELPLPSHVCKAIKANRQEFFSLENARLSPTSMSILRKNNPEKYQLFCLGLLCYKNDISIEDMIDLVNMKKALGGESFRDSLNVLDAIGGIKNS
ncbi:hypothetical protein [Poseidonibacter ostreae]|uniref:Uncharacterized protein n=1 Tax=Poseidonibacter ostreae TaxID=2654171 RepID=A0A6L4WWT8_9BACT|nr:hypothetical protein [Poseidonibacter ostreae]KAB7891337.1 hypothetical protein GBG19_00440 [Poseidonibacter ostreae]